VVLLAERVTYFFRRNSLLYVIGVSSTGNKTAFWTPLRSI